MWINKWCHDTSNTLFNAWQSSFSFCGCTDLECPSICCQSSIISPFVLAEAVPVMHNFSVIVSWWLIRVLRPTRVSVQYPCNSYDSITLIFALLLIIITRKKALGKVQSADLCQSAILNYFVKRHILCQKYILNHSQAKDLQYGGFDPNLDLDLLKVK